MEIKDIFGDLPTLETKRLLLRKYKKEDMDDLYEYASDEEVTRYLTFETYKNMEDANQYIQTLLEKYRNGNEVSPWAIEWKQNHKMIGSIGINQWDIENYYIQIGYVLNKKYWNQGIMTEALKAVIDFAFKNMNIERIELTHDVRNIGSGKVMLKNGLKQEGILRKSKYIKGEFIDRSYYSILREEYESQKGGICN